jgi:hypothetical protein
MGPARRDHDPDDLSLGLGRARKRDSAFHPSGAGSRVGQPRERLGHPDRRGLPDRVDHVPCAHPRRGGGRGARDPVQPVEDAGAFLLPLRGDPAGHAHRLDRAAHLHLRGFEDRGHASLCLARGLLPGAQFHHARPQLRRSQPARPLPHLRRHALAAAALPATALGAALLPRRAEDRGRPQPDRRGGGGACRWHRRHRFRPRLPHPGGGIPAQHRADVRRPRHGRGDGRLHIRALSVLSHLLLRKWHESAVSRET